MSLFTSIAPLAERMRPQKLEDYVGQEKLVGPNGIITRVLEHGNTPSMILWGPPGTGKTTLAMLIAHAIEMPFIALSAISSGIKEVREVIEQAKRNGNILLFIDEIHRFNKTQQDALLGAVEKGFIKLIGATTENPSFEVNNALLSRCQVYVLEDFGKKELEQILSKAITEDEILSKYQIEVRETDELFRSSGGDGRKLLNLVELTLGNQAGNKKVISNEQVKKALMFNASKFDKGGEFHYDIISAFIKSMRGSDPDAAVYWLARMIRGGEEAEFIARRMVIFAAEDIGLANPNALLMAVNTFQGVSMIGMPEGRILLSNCAVYLATSAKSNSTYMAINDALAEVDFSGDLPVPIHLRNSPTKLMKDLGYGKEYLYPHEFQNNFTEQDYLPQQIKGKKFYKSGNNARERETAKMWDEVKKKK